MHLFWSWSLYLGVGLSAIIFVSCISVGFNGFPILLGGIALEELQIIVKFDRCARMNSIGGGTIGSADFELATPHREDSGSDARVK